MLCSNFSVLLLDWYTEYMLEKPQQGHNHEQKVATLESWKARVARGQAILESLIVQKDTEDSELSEKQKLFKTIFFRETQNIEKFLLNVSYRISSSLVSYFNFTSFADAVRENPSQLRKGESQYISLADIEAAFLLSNRLENALKSQNHLKVEDVLVILREQVVSQLFAERALEMSRELMVAFAPSFTPILAAEVIVSPLSTGFPDNATYYGIYDEGNKRHVIDVEVVLDPYRDVCDEELTVEFISAVISGIHELMHAWHTEQIYESFGGNISVEPAVETNSTQLVVGHTPESFDRLSQEHSELSSYLTEESIDQAVSEGIAVFFEVLILAEWKKQVYLEMPSVSSEIQRYFNTRFAELRHREDVEYPTNPSYYTGLQIMRKLIAFFSLEELVSIIADIDVLACDEIQLDSERGQKIISDPRLLPGLEKNAVVQASLKNDRKAH